MQPHELRSDGQYLRCLEDKAIALRFSNDHQAEHGYRLRSPSDWKWAPGDLTGGLSVSLCGCVSSVRCSPFLHPDPDRFEHVTRIDLSALALALDMKLVAMYTPDSTNPCHFEIIPLEDSLQDLRVRLRGWVEKKYPPNVKVPSQPKQLEVAASNRQAYETVFLIFASVKQSVSCQCLTDSLCVPTAKVSESVDSIEPLLLPAPEITSTENES